MTFETFGTAGDAGLRAEASTLGLLLSELALGFAALSSPGKVSPSETKALTISAAGAGELAVKFLNELVFLADTESFLPAAAEASLKETSGTYELSALLRGETSAFARHPRGLLIKAATYHKLIVEQRGTLWYAEVILDI